MGLGGVAVRGGVLGSPCFFFVCFLGVLLFRAAPAAYGSSQTRGRIGAIAAGLHHRHSNAESELLPRPIPQLTETPDP